MERFFLKISIVFIFITTFPGSSGFSASNELTWREVLKEAQSKNPDLGIATANQDNYQAQYSGSYSNLMPQFSLSGGYTESNQTIVNSGAVTSEASGGNVGQYQAGITVTQGLFSGFQTIGAIRQAKANLQVAQDRLALAKITLSSNLKSAFAQLLYQQLSVELSSNILARQEKNLRLVTMHYEGGQENKGNQLYQAATVAQARYNYEHSKRQGRNAIKQLAVLMGRPETDNIQVRGELVANLNITPETFHSLAMKHPTQLQNLHQQEAADAAVTVADSGWYPSINATGYIGKMGSNFPPESHRWSVGVSINFPFFPGTSQIYQAGAARAQRVQAEYSSTSNYNKLIAGMETAYAALKDALEQVDVADKFEKAANARSVISTEKYNSGLMTFEDWTVIETDLINRQLNLLQSKLNAAQAQATWESAAGLGDLL
jgi:outer membrane protein TolC